MSTEPRPNRWDDLTCNVPECPCNHAAYPNNCDRGFIRAFEGATTPGTRAPTGLGVIPGVALDLDAATDAVRRCPVCRAHAERRGNR